MNEPGLVVRRAPCPTHSQRTRMNGPPGPQPTPIFHPSKNWGKSHLYGLFQLVRSNYLEILELGHFGHARTVFLEYFQDSKVPVLNMQ
jgi:hypothetical protein